jgi:biotin-(acetyl-CoA carboxylase) ligase
MPQTSIKYVFNNPFLFGIGINVNMTPEELAFVRTPASSMYAETLKTFDKEAILNTLSNHLKISLASLLEEGFPCFYEGINQFLAFKYDLIEFELNQNSVIQGKVLGIDKDGALLLRMPDKEILKTFSGRILRVIE